MSDAAQVIVTEQGEAAVILAVPGVQGQGGQDVTDLSYNPSTRVLSSSTGTGTTLPLATTTLPGLESPEDKIKLDSVQAGAQPNVNADWNSTSGNAQILNKPVLGGAAALDVGSTAGTVAAGDDGRLNNSREWIAETVTQVEAEAGTAATRRAFTAQRVFQAVAAWWAGSAAKTKLDGIAPGAQVNVATDISYDAPSREVRSSTGANATLPLVSVSAAGLAPATGTPTGKFLRDDGSYSVAGSPPAGSSGDVQLNLAGSFGVVAGFNWVSGELQVPGDIRLSGGGSFQTTLQLVTPTAARTITFPDLTGTVALVGGSSGQTLYNLNGAVAGTGTTFSAATGTRFSLQFGYGSGGVVTQQTNKETAVTLNTACGNITMNGAALAGSAVAVFTLNSDKIESGDFVGVNHVSGGAFGNYYCDARAANGSASVMIRNLTSGSLSDAIVLRFSVIKGALS